MPIDNGFLILIKRNGTENLKSRGQRAVPICIIAAQIAKGHLRVALFMPNLTLIEHCHATGPQFDYQLDRHCSKTTAPCPCCRCGFDYQLDRHCSKTPDGGNLDNRIGQGGAQEQSAPIETRATPTRRYERRSGNGHYASYQPVGAHNRSYRTRLPNR